MFLGIHRTYFSGKNRIILPKKFRKELGIEDKFYLVKGLDGEIWGFSKTEWLKEAEKRLSVPITEIEGRVQRRRFFSQAEECILDNQGRFIINGDLLVGSGITNEILLVGAGDHFEIWDPKAWEKVMESLVISH